ncbi:MAG: hypothetical protein MAG431_02047 [Chloroflexi bacterium]|nr:hypothetical protein [Chloroflexota bacterium]
MTWNDFLQNTDIFTTDLSVTAIAYTLLFSFALGLFIFFIYRVSYQGVMYSKTFNVTLIAISMITSSIILAISSNIILSLGMVGALSIVRFRTAIKDPIDVAYIFWAVGMGITSGAGLWKLASMSAIVIGIILFVFSHISDVKTPYLCVISYQTEDTNDLVFKLIEKETKRYRLKSKVFDGENYEVTIEIRRRKKTDRLVNKLGGINHVNSVALLGYDGDFAV